MNFLLTGAVLIIYGIIGSQACCKPNNVSPACGRRVGTSTCRRFQNSCTIDYNPGKNKIRMHFILNRKHFCTLSDFEEVPIGQCVNVDWSEDSPCSTVGIEDPTTCDVNEVCNDPVENVCGIQQEPLGINPNAPLPKCRTFKNLCELRRYNCQQQKRQQQINPNGPVYVEYVLADNARCRGIAITPRNCAPIQ